MPAGFDALLAQAMALTPEQRLELADLLWASVEGPIDEDEEFLTELARRDAEMDTGTVASIPYEQAMQEIRDSLGLSGEKKLP